MLKVSVLQTDNRPSLAYLLKTQKVNKKFCDILGIYFVDIFSLKEIINLYDLASPSRKK